MNFILPLFLLAVTLPAETTLYRTGESLYFEKGCNGCHGTKAEGMTGYPGLANRAKGFLAYKLERFRDKLSDSQQQEMMIPFAQNLSDADIKALSTFLSDFRDEQTEQYDSEYVPWGDGGS